MDRKGLFCASVVCGLSLLMVTAAYSSKNNTYMPPSTATDKTNSKQNENTQNGQQQNTEQNATTTNNNNQKGNGQGTSGNDTNGRLPFSDPIIIPTGNFFREEIDLPSARKASVLYFTRFYNSLKAGSDGIFGDGWSYRFNMKIAEVRDGVVVIWEDGTTQHYRKKKDRFIRPPATPNELTRDRNGAYSLTTPQKVVYAFDSPYHKNLTRISDPLGTLYELEYDKITKTLTKITDRWGDWVKFTYNASSKVSEVEDSAGRKVTYKYNRLKGLLESVTDVLGDETVNEYDSRNNLSEKRYSDGVKVLTQFDDRRRAVAQGNHRDKRMYRFVYDDRKSKVTCYEKRRRVLTAYYNSMHKIVKSVDAAGNVETNTYDKSGHTTKKKAVNGAVSKYRYDTLGNITEIIDPLGATTEFQYDPRFNKVSVVVDPAGARTEFVRDEKGLVSEIVDPEGAKTKFDRNKWGLPTEITPAQGAAVKISYDERGNVTRVERRLGEREDDLIVEKYKRDPLGNITEYTDPNGKLTRFAYDAKGRMVSREMVRSGKILKMAVEYDQFDNVVAVRDPLGRITKFEYSDDWWSKLVRVDYPDGGVERRKYDIYGNLVAVIGRNGLKTRFKYDVLGRVTAKIGPGGNVWRYRYDKAGNVTEIADPEKNKRLFAYDAAGRVVEEKDAEGYAVKFEYTVDGDLRRLIDQNKGEIGWAYDRNGRLIKEKNQLGIAVSYAYDDAGRLVSKAYDDGWKSAYEYDPIGRLTGRKMPDGTAVSYEYDRAGNILSVKGDVGDAQRDISFGYDEFYRVVSVRSGERELKYEYDDAGNRTKMSIGGEMLVTYGYDAMNRLIEARAGNDGISYTYDAGGRRAAKKYPNGVTTAYGYDEAGRLALLETRGREGDRIDAAKYFYDRAGNKISVLTDGGTTTYAYDKNYQLTEAKYPDGVGETFTYDGVGNRLAHVVGTIKDGKESKEKTLYAYNAAHQLMKVSSSPLRGEVGERVISYQYDRRGNLAKESDGSAETLYEYNGENRLAAVKKQGENIASFGYDVLGRRVMKQGKGEAESFVYDGLQIAMVLNGRGRVREKYYYGAGIDEAVSVRGARNNDFAGDDLGSVTAVLDPAGTVKERYRYRAFGDCHRPPARFGFTGREYDESTGMYYYRARYYNPMLGRFLAQDPLGMPDGVNRYAYVRNNPVRWVDPLGLLTIIAYGSYASDEEWGEEGSSFAQSVGQTFGETPVSFRWSGGNNAVSRAEAAVQLQAFIERNSKPGEPVNYVGHSHAGNVAFLASQYGTKFNVVATLGTPIRSDYTPNMSNIEKVCNVYSKSDEIQTIGGNKYTLFGDEFGPAKRTIDKSGNIENIEVQNREHSELHTSDTWKEVQGIVNSRSGKGK